MLRKQITSVLALLMTGTAALAEMEWDSGVPVGPIEIAAADDTAVAYDAPEQMELTFMFHIDEGLAEQDVFYERIPGSGEVFRPTGATRDMNAMLYRPDANQCRIRRSIPADIGPWQKGASARNHARRVVGGDRPGLPTPARMAWDRWISSSPIWFRTGSIRFGMTSLSGRQPIRSRVSMIIPFGARDGSENSFRADAKGSALVSCANIIALPPAFGRAADLGARDCLAFG